MLKKLWSIVAVVTVVIATIVSKAPVMVSAATIIGVLFVLCVAYKKPVAPLLGAFLSVLYAVLSYQAGFFANAVMNLFILTPLQLWGWYFWTKTKEKTFSLSNKQSWLIWGLSGIASSIMIHVSQDHGSAHYILDGISSVLVVTGTILLTFKTRDQWSAWIPYNTIECIMWFYAMSLEPSVIAIFVMRVIFLVNSLIGAKEWFSDQTSVEVTRR